MGKLDTAKKEKIEKLLPDFAHSVQSEKLDALERRINLYTKELLKDLNAPYNDAKKHLEMKISYVIDLIEDKGCYERVRIGLQTNLGNALEPICVIIFSFVLLSTNKLIKHPINPINIVFILCFHIHYEFGILLLDVSTTISHNEI